MFVYDAYAGTRLLSALLVQMPCCAAAPRDLVNASLYDRGGPTSWERKKYHESIPYVECSKLGKRLEMVEVIGFAVVASFDFQVLICGILMR